MKFMWLRICMLSSICYAADVVIDDQCDESCNCCIDGQCHEGKYFSNTCTIGCIDGHRGARCYELCQYERCKSCGGSTADSKVCTECYDGYNLGSTKDCTVKCPSNCKSCISSTQCTECYDGYYPESNKCTPCPINCESCTSITMCTKCKEGFYDKDGSTTCEYVRCPANCECNNQGDCISCKNGYFDMSTSCTKQCPVNCLTCESGEACNECKDGFYNGHKYDKIINFQLNNCTYRCRDNCTQCQSYNTCLQCIDGKYGNTCQDNCSIGCKDKTCLFDSGQCTCTADFTGDKCMKCVDGNYGLLCNETCSKYCKGNICERTSGYCTDGCLNENLSGNICNTCKVGTFDEYCDKICPENCKNVRCERFGGSCSDGCISNFNGTRCDVCIHGKYGMKCALNCPDHCAGNVCDRHSGKCYECDGNFQGDTCDECKSGFYGPNCDVSCSPHCSSSSCHSNNGTCVDGCKSGYSGDKCCVMSEHCDECETNIECKRCVPGFFKKYCNETCPGSCDGSCLISTGVCVKAAGPLIDESDTSIPTGPIAGGVAAFVVVAAAGVVASVFFLRRRRLQKDSKSKDVDNGALPSRRNDLKPPVKEKPVYANTKKGTKDKDADLEDVILDETNDSESDDETGYYNFNSVNTNIKVENLFSYVIKDHFDSFEKEFKNLPKPGDLSILCKVAKKPENIASNRYNGIYPFDHSRVTIPAEPKFFINACYINGYNSRSNAYIASFGPTEKTTKNFTTFWRMVWHEKSEIIVMLTNLREPSGMKCEQYWPEKGELNYGDVKVTCRSIEEFAEYTVRCFTIWKGKEKRNVTQMHFTAWPDKGVPSEVTSIIEFRQRVKAAAVVLNGPVIVHCSAGVGRTGTYIALDILSEQGKAEGSVNVFNCVSEMRGQRVNMVQTAEQYIFLHKALVHTLTFGCEALTAEELQSLAFDEDSTFARMFQILRQEVDIEQDEEIAAREQNKRIHADKSRPHSDIPGNRGRVRLYLRRKTGNHDYINATFISSFKYKNLFIAAQTPQSNTVEDFICMIYQQNSACVVSMDDMLQLSKKHDVGIYLPADNETYKCGEFTVTSAKCENKPQYTIKKLTIKHTDKGEEKTAYHFQYTKWGDGRRVADSPGDFVQFIKDVEKYVKQQKADMPNMVVHCLNGYERCGLFCVVYTLLEKLEAERTVSVVNVIRKVRTQRKRSISAMEQLKFCYQCISAYLESFNTYSNFAI